MKTNRLIALMAIPTFFVSVYAMVPKIEKKCHYVKVTGVERTDSSLRVGVRLQNYPNYWVQMSPSSRIIDANDTTRQYKILGSEGFNLGEHVWMPASGYIDGTLVYENVPENVKIVDLIETDYSDVNSNILGIHLNEEEIWNIPKMVTMDDIVSVDNPNSESWNGLNPKLYSDLSFYDKDAKSVVKGQIIDYSPKYGFSTFSIRTNDDFTRKEKINVGNINADGSFEIEVPVTYPQFDYFEMGNIHKNLFLIPGDTLSIVTCMSTNVDPKQGYIPEYFGFDGKPDDGTIVNILTDSLLYKRYPIKNLFRQYYVAESDSMKSETYRSNARLGMLLDSVIADLPVLLKDLPISNYSKDILSSIAIGNICEMMEELDMYFQDAKGGKFKLNDDGTHSYHEGDRLDYGVFLAPRLKHKDLTFNNPLLIFNGFVLPNRWEFNDIFRNSGFAAIGMKEIAGGGGYVWADDITEPYSITENNLDSIGVGNCFVNQFVMANNFINRLLTVETPSYATLERYNTLVPLLIKHIDCRKLNEIIMDAYSNFIKDVMIAENAINSDDSSILIEGRAEGEVLNKIIAPYKGNVLFLDFWGIGCGPCRAGMIKQKPLLEELADRPFRALYIANSEEGLEACKKWLRNEEIKGEHIFVTGDDWKRLCGLFNISGIPHGVLIGKDGRIINPAYHFSIDDPQLKKALEE